MNHLNLLRQVLITPSIVSTFSIDQWNELIHQGYATNLLGRICALLTEQKLNEAIPSAVRWHFSSALTLAQAHQHDVEIEIGKIRQALKMGGINPIFLKGAAYVIANDKAAKGRLFADVDIFLPKQQLANAERLLKWNGWSQGEIDEYDEQYYRRWMHEIPALVHRGRGNTLDVHHNLLPLTCRTPLDAEKLQLNIPTDASILTPEDRIIHSAAHLLLESEFDKGIRDLSDLDLLLREHGTDNPQFWDELISRSQLLGLPRLVFYALRYTHLFLNTPIPQKASLALSPYAPNKLLLRIMDWLFKHVLTAPLALNKSRRNKLAHLAMLVRGHWMKMPMHLLVPHLFHKAFITPYHNWKKETLTNNESTAKSE